LPKTINLNLKSDFYSAGKTPKQVFRKESKVLIRENFKFRTVLSATTAYLWFLLKRVATIGNNGSSQITGFTGKSVF